MFVFSSSTQIWPIRWENRIDAALPTNLRNMRYTSGRQKKIDFDTNQGIDFKIPTLFYYYVSR